jgi:large subunit ribosomal protein L21
MKYAVLNIGGKQFVAEEGQAIDVDRMSTEVGKSVEFNEVLLVVDGAKVKVGKPKVAGAKVKVTVAEHVKAPKITVFKFKPKQRYRRKQGHRQPMTRLSIDKITVAAPRKKSEEKDVKAAAKSKKPAAARVKTTKTSTQSEAKAKSASKSTSKSSTKKKSAKD